MKKTVLILMFALLSLVAQAQDYPVTLEHKFGSTTLEQTPTRIVSLGFNEEDPLFALGAKPLAVRFWLEETENGVTPWAQEAANGASAQVFNMPELNYEAILALEPDFITAQYMGLDQNTYDTLSQIAPTLAPAEGYPDYGMPWQEMTRSLGQALGKAGEADAAIAATTQAQDAARQTLEAVAADQEVAVVLPNEAGGYYAYTPEDSRGQLFVSLGFTIPEAFAGEDTFYVDISEERADLLDVDLLVFIGADSAEASQSAVANDPLLRQLEVVKEGRVIYIVNTLRAAMSYNTVLSIPYALEEVVPLVQEVLE